YTAEAELSMALIGSLAADKSPIDILIPRLHDATSGQVLLDGVPVTDLARATISRTVGLVPQKPYLFSGTVAHNLRFGDPSADDEQLWRALDVAQGTEFAQGRTTGEG